MTSGGAVFFCLFALPDSLVQQQQQKQAQQQQAGGIVRVEKRREGVVVLKFCATRLQTQAEQLAGELARHCGVPAPPSRIIHQASAGQSLSLARVLLCAVCAHGLARHRSTPR